MKSVMRRRRLPITIRKEEKLMMNQWTLDTLYHSVYGDPDLEQSDDICEEELYHHGVLGQSWGRRHGPPYPLDGVDKKIARAEAKRKRERERRLKKLQRAAKKARKLKKKQEKQEADTLKKKQKLVKSGDMDKIRKNADLFNNDELQYILERDAMKRGLGGEKERTADEKFDLAMKRMGQIADIAVKGGQVFSAMKQGAEMVSAFHDVKIKDLKKEGERLSNVEKEFKLRMERDPGEAMNYLNSSLGGPKYKGEKESKESKLEDKAARALRREKAEADLKGIEDRAKQAEKDEKNAKAAEKQAKKDEKQKKKDEKDFRREQKDYEKGLEGLESIFEKKKAADKKEYLKKLGVTEDVTAKPTVSIGDSDISSGKDFVQNFDFPKWYTSDFQDQASAPKKKNVADFIDAPTVRDWSRKQAENRGKQTYPNYPGRDDAIDPLIAKPMAMRTSSIEPQKLEPARKTVSSFLDSPEVKTMSSKIPKPVDGGIHGGGIQVPGSFDDYISPYQSVKKPNSQWTDRTKDTMWTLNSALAQPSRYTEAPHETARKWANEYINASQKTGHDTAWPGKKSSWNYPDQDIDHTTKWSGDRGAWKRAAAEEDFARSYDDAYDKAYDASYKKQMKKYEGKPNYKVTKPTKGIIGVKPSHLESIRDVQNAYRKYNIDFHDPKVNKKFGDVTLSPAMAKKLDSLSPKERALVNRYTYWGYMGRPTKYGRTGSTYKLTSEVRDQRAREIASLDATKAAKDFLEAYLSKL
ncbi:MAG: hypothetical protein J6U28_00775 [Bacteroidales bacterium]|nr:hypothetical protein [Bacteroidales bacterium]